MRDGIESTNRVVAEPGHVQQSVRADLHIDGVAGRSRLRQQTAIIAIKEERLAAAKAPDDQLRRRERAVFIGGRNNDVVREARIGKRVTDRGRVSGNGLHTAITPVDRPAGDRVRAGIRGGE